MGVQSQFSLSLEVTRALGPAAVAQSGDTLLKWARALQRNGSDIIIEQDLGGLFSRFQIDPDFAQEFKERTLAVNEVKTISSYFPIALQAGPGATVQRALQDRSFMPMVIHLSMFGATHELGSFAEALAEVLRIRTEDHEDQEPPFFPPQTIKGTLQVCVEQTSGFKWHLLIDTIMRMLDLPQYVPGKSRKNMPRLNAVEHFYRLSMNQLQVGMDILLSLHQVRTDRVMVIRGSRGIVPMILWSHFLLGLTVMVKGSPAGDVMFGKGHASVTIEYASDAVQEYRPSELFLMEPAPFSDVLLTIREDGPSAIEPIGRRMLPIKGYASRLLGSLLAVEGDSECLGNAAQVDLAHYAAALAILVGRNLYDLVTINNKNHIPNFLRKNPKPILESIELVLDDMYDLQQIQSVTEQLRGAKVMEYPPPSSLSRLNHPHLRQSQWLRLLRSTVDLAHIILTFAAVGDLNVCKDILIGDVNVVENEGSLRPLSTWDGISKRSWGANDPYSSMAHLLQDSRDTSTTEKSVLFSCHGWSVYREVLVQKDPAAYVRSRFWIHRGVPRSKGASTRRIRDGPSNMDTQARHIEMVVPPHDLHKAVQEATSAYPVSVIEPSIHMSTEEWTVNQRFLQAHEDRVPVFVGYRALDGAACSVSKLIECEHAKGTAHPRENAPSHIQLYPNTALSRGFYFLEKTGGPRKCIAQTYGNSLARWLALAGRSASQAGRSVVLRKESACLDCFMEAACQVDCSRDGLYLIL